jgi:NaMN:DMB phosphoribosyltransferase
MTLPVNVPVGSRLSSSDIILEEEPMTSIPENVPSIALVSRVRLVLVGVALFVAITGAFVAGRVTAPNADARAMSIRPARLTGSLQSSDGRRRAEVMRKMNHLAHADG